MTARLKQGLALAACWRDDKLGADMRVDCDVQIPRVHPWSSPALVPTALIIPSDQAIVPTMSFQRDRPISYDAPPSDSESAPSDRAPSCEPPQTSLDLARFDRQTLHAGDEQQRLLLQSRQAKDGEPQARGLLGGMRRFGGRQSYRDEPAAPEDVQKQGGPRKRQRRSGLEKRELLHAMEEGGEGSLTPSSDEGSGIEAEKKELSLGGKRVCCSCSCSFACCIFRESVALVSYSHSCSGQNFVDVGRTTG